MIVRVFRTITEPGKRETFETFFRASAAPLIKAAEGLVDLKFGLPSDATPDEFAIIMVWRDLDALKAFVGENWETAHIHPNERGIVKERHLHHYELMTVND